MSLVAPRMEDRASVLLPTVTCSTCGDSIALSSLGDHICKPVSRSMGSRSAPRPSQIAIPSPRANQSHSNGREYRQDQDRYNPPRPAFAGPSSVRSSPGSSTSSLMIPETSTGRSPSQGGGKLSPYSIQGGSPSPRTPSPTNPFFPGHVQDDKGPIALGLGLTVSSRPEGPFPTDAPLPAGASDLLGYNTGGIGGGMAGVGRRAFQAAAWGVTAGLTMAAAGKSRSQEGYNAEPTSHQQPAAHAQPRSAGVQPSSRPPWQQEQRSYSSSSVQTQQSSSLPRPPFTTRQRSGTMSNGSDVDRNPPSSYAPQSLRQDSLPPRSASALDTASNAPTAAPPRSTSAMSSRNAQARRPSVSSVNSSTKSDYENGNGNGDGIAQLLKARSMDRKPSADKGAFFERYKQMQRSTSNSSQSRLGIRPPQEEILDDEYLVASPQQTRYDLDSGYDRRRRAVEDDEDEASALPWATPMLQDSPEINQPPVMAKTYAPDYPSRVQHRRQPTNGSASSSSNSSTGSGRYGISSSGPESEEIVTPSQSVEGFSDRAPHASKPVSRNQRNLRQIHESDEDESDRVVFGQSSSSHDHHGYSQSSRSASDKTIKAMANGAGSNSHSRTRTTSNSKTTPAAKPTSLSAPTGQHRSKPAKHCQKCGEGVGGSRKFVERDGVILCEFDWKKMYLPTCRKCDKLIETKMVSADDGQLKGKWHASCFTCTRCDEGFDGGDFYVHNGKPWCQYHYAQETDTLCCSRACGKPIEGACIVTQGSNDKLQRFHPGHLNCEHPGGRCMEDMEEYFDVGPKKYCERHVGEALKALRGSGSGGLGASLRAEKRKTRLVDLPKGGMW